MSPIKLGLYAGGAWVLWRVYQAQKYGVSIEAALTSFAPVSQLAAVAPSSLPAPSPATGQVVQPPIVITMERTS